MKIVIDIPEKYLNSSSGIVDVTLFTGENNAITDVNVEDTYAKFQVLPKEHGDLIDKSKLVFYRCKENVMDCPPNYDFTCQTCDYGWTCRLNIDEAPIVIPADKGE